MIVVQTIGWIAVAIILYTYSQVTRRPRWFDWANALGAIPVALPAILTGAYPPAALSLSFGAIGAWNLYKRKKLITAIVAEADSWTELEGWDVWQDEWEEPVE